jgi:aminopeptidase-like protein
MSADGAAAPDAKGMYQLIEELYPVCRSITGDGVRQTLQRIAARIPLQIRDVPTGTPVLDWTIPREWNIRDAWIATTSGTKVVDFRQSSLHVVNYSHPIRARVSREELERHLYSLPDRPDWVPYRTSYYNESWGFCLSQRQRESLVEPEYDVHIDSSLTNGSLTYGEAIISGRIEDEVLLSTHVCHPSLANDNLSGIAVLSEVVRHLQRQPRRYTYRAIFAPGTIGALAWLAAHESDVHRIRHGLVLSCLGDRGGFTYKRSRRGNSEIDRAVPLALNTAAGVEERPFSPDGYDERQYCSPGFNLPVGRLTRTPNGEYPEYHTSADNLELVTPERLAESVEALLSIVDVLEGNDSYVNTHPKGEPQLGRRGLYRSIGGGVGSAVQEDAVRWVLNFSDGEHSLLDIAEQSRLPFGALRSAADVLLRLNLIAPRS